MIPAVILILLAGQPSVEFLRGVEFGITEMAHTARLLGTDVQLVRNATADQRVHGVVVASGRSEAPKTIPHIFNEATAEDENACAFSLTAAKRGDQRLALWHPSLQKYGASELNERFMRKYGTAMTEDAWSGWVAVKALVESTLRQPDAADRCAALASLRFDGHKGRPLHFDASTRALSQPVYVLKDGKVVGEKQ